MGGIFVKEKLFDSEAKVMDIIWEKTPISAKEISLIAAETIGWNKNTTYTVIKKLEAKGFIQREDPGFICIPLVSQSEMQKVEVASLVKKVFGGSRKALFSALLEDEPLSEEEINELRKLIDNSSDVWEESVIDLSAIPELQNFQLPEDEEGDQWSARKYYLVIRIVPYAEADRWDDAFGFCNNAECYISKPDDSVDHFVKLTGSLK